VTGTFQTISATGLLASAFQLLDFTTGTVDGTQHPDFSASGGLIDFGTRVSFGHINMVNSGGTLDVRLDNLNITLTTTPEPGAYELVAAGLAGLWFLRRRRARS
jgi:MYXO-CTERM domain-containing protein